MGLFKAIEKRTDQFDDAGVRMKQSSLSPLLYENFNEQAKQQIKKFNVVKSKALKKLFDLFAKLSYFEKSKFTNIMLVCFGP